MFATGVGLVLRMEGGWVGSYLGDFSFRLARPTGSSDNSIAPCSLRLVWHFGFVVCTGMAMTLDFVRYVPPTSGAVGACWDRDGAL